MSWSIVTHRSQAPGNHPAQMKLTLPKPALFWHLNLSIWGLMFTCSTSLLPSQRGTPHALRHSATGHPTLSTLPQECSGAKMSDFQGLASVCNNFLPRKLFFKEHNPNPGRKLLANSAWTNTNINLSICPPCGKPDPTPLIEQPPPPPGGGWLLGSANGPNGRGKQADGIWSEG